MGRKSKNSTRARSPVGSRLRATITTLALLTACGSPESPTEQESTTPSTGGSVDFAFVEVAAEVGLHFVHQNGMDGNFYYPEMMGSGVALFDYDRDGDLDVYCVQGHALQPGDPPVDGPRDRLFRNDLEHGVLRFTDVTAESGLDARGYGMGVTVFDADGDGWNDLYLTNLGRNQLWRNQGSQGNGSQRNGSQGNDPITFEDITAASGTEVEGWSVPAAVLDIDHDGRLDLFVGQYLEYDLATDPPCRDELGTPNYCGPLTFKALPDRLLHNQGPGPDGVVRFEDIGPQTGITAEFGRTLGALAVDLNGDGWSDLYVANDGTANQLWMHRGAGMEGPLFENRAVLAGAAVNGLGAAEASMGLAAADFDFDGDEDLVVTHLRRETNTLYVNDGQGHFTDGSAPTGLGPPSLPKTAFGVGWLDLENDGDLDLFVVNGAVKVIKALALAGDPVPLHQPNQLFKHRGDGTFEEISRDLGPAFALSEVSRGAAFGDLDNDGDTDVVVLNNGGPVRLFENRLGQDHSWIGIHLRLADGGDALGARAAVVTPEGTLHWRRSETAASYASSNDPRLLFGLGGDTGEQKVRVEWPDGRLEVFENLPPRTWLTLEEGRGQRLEETP